MFSNHSKLRRCLWTVGLVSSCVVACKSRRLPDASPSANVASASVAGATPSPLPTTSHPFAAEPLTLTPALPYESIAMALPQPVAEPTPAEDPTQYTPANPPWPDEFTEVYGSELIAKIKEAARSGSLEGVLINAWASWCGPCKTEMPMLLEIQQRYRTKGLEVWFVSVDKPDQAFRVKEVLEERRVPLPHYVVKGRLGYFKEALSPIWKGSLPSTFLFDAEGRVRYYWGAHVFENELTPLLDDFLAGKLVDGVANFKVRRGPPNP